MKRNVFLWLLLMLFFGISIKAETSPKPRDIIYTTSYFKIYPTPQSIWVRSENKYKLTPTLTIVADKQIDEATLERAKTILTEKGLKFRVSKYPSMHNSNLFLAVNKSHSWAERYCSVLDRRDREIFNKADKFDKHIIDISESNGKADIRILGEHCNATFFGLATLEQILERSTKELEHVMIKDYADQESRGLVEGYYGYPYSIAVKKDLMRFMMRMKMNTYMYGAKSDPYHSEKWEDAYPKELTQEQIKNGLVSEAMLQDLAKTSQQTKVNFIWAIHPGNDFVASDNVNKRIMHKFTKMYDLGIRQFAVFVDDVGVPQTEAECQKNADRLTELQKAIDSKWNEGAKEISEKVRPLHFVPQVYTLSWVKLQDRKRFYKALSTIPEKITVYFTGRGVWTVPNEEDLKTIKEDFGRKLAWWWNYPCNDNADGQIFPSDMYYNFFEMPAVDGKSRLPKALENGLGIVSNPMQQGEVSKTALFSVADYAWNNSRFDNEQSWEDSFNYTLSTTEKREAYKAVIPYLRWNGPEEMKEATESYKQGNKQPLHKLSTSLLEQIKIVKGFETSSIETDRLLYQDIKPWLNKVEAMMLIAKNMSVPTKTTEEQWERYVSNLQAIESLKTDTAFTAYALEGLGSHISTSHRQSEPSSKYLMPFMIYLKEKAKFFLENKTVAIIKSEGVKSQSTPTLQHSNGVVSLNAEDVLVPSKGYFGLAFRQPVKAQAIQMNKSWVRANKIRYSSNGTDWHKLKGKHFPQNALIKYIIYRNKSSQPKSLTWTKEDLSIQLPHSAKCSEVLRLPSERVGAASDQKLGKGCIIDSNPNTFYACGRNQKDGDIYEVSLEKPSDVSDVRVYFGLVNDDFIEEGQVEVSSNGKEWQKLQLKGREQTQAGVKEATKYTDQIAYLDFVGKAKAVKFVRLTLSKGKTNKWLRLYEISVNHSAEANAFVPNAPIEVCDGKAYTFTKDKNLKAISYKVQSIKPVKSLLIYWNPKAYASTEKPKVFLYQGSKLLQDAGVLEKAYTEVCLPADASDCELRITYPEGQVPAIHQIVEQY